MKKILKPKSAKINISQSEKRIDELYEQMKSGYFQNKWKAAEKKLVQDCLNALDQGHLRICEKIGASWITNAWLKKVVLLSFQAKNFPIRSGDLQFWDKIAVKKWKGTEGVRVVPPAVVRKGAFVQSGVILMPCFINIGAYVDSGSMIDTWATVGSCAQVGKNVHVSGGVGIGGVLEPAQAQPVIIEDHVFLGSRCIVVEGAIIEEGAVLAAGVTITASTKIVDVTGHQMKITTGKIPARSVVIPGTIPKQFPAGEFGTACALIIGQRKKSTDEKTSLNNTLREFDLSV